MFASVIAFPPASLAQFDAPKPEFKGSLDNDILKAREQELAAIRAEQQRAAENEARLRSEIETLGTDRRKLNTDLIGTAARDARGRSTAGGKRGPRRTAGRSGAGAAAIAQRTSRHHRGNSGCPSAYGTTAAASFAGQPGGRRKIAAQRHRAWRLRSGIARSCRAAVGRSRVPADTAQRHRRRTQQTHRRPEDPCGRPATHDAAGRGASEAAGGIGTGAGPELAFRPRRLPGRSKALPIWSRVWSRASTMPPAPRAKCRNPITRARPDHLWRRSAILAGWLRRSPLPPPAARCRFR